MQAPTPAEVAPIVIPIMGMLTGIVMTGMVVLGPVGRAFGDVLRHWLGGGRHEKQLSAGVQLAELAERQDFAERLLAQVKKERALPGSVE